MRSSTSPSATGTSLPLHRTCGPRKKGAQSSLSRIAHAVRRTAWAILDSDDCAPFFRGPHVLWSGNEVPVADGEVLLRIDRLVLLEGSSALPVNTFTAARCAPAPDASRSWWVLDYKLRHAPDELEPYRQQLLRYRDAVRRLSLI